MYQIMLHTANCIIILLKSLGAGAICRIAAENSREKWEIWAIIMQLAVRTR
jgi:hypothetical protein